MDLPVEHLATFAAIVDEGSFEGAARRLHITPSAVSQRVRAAAWAEGVRGRELVRHHLIAADKGEGL